MSAATYCKKENFNISDYVTEKEALESIEILELKNMLDCSYLNHRYKSTYVQ